MFAKVLLFSIFIAMGFFILEHSFFVTATSTALAALAAVGLVIYFIAKAKKIIP